MKHVITALAALFVFASAYTQSPKQEKDAPAVLLFLQHQTDIAQLKADFRAQSTPVSERPRLVMRALMQAAEATQPALLAKLAQLPGIVSTEKFWIVNMIRVQATEAAIAEMRRWPEIARIERENDYTGIPVQPRPAASVPDRSPGGIEPGLAAINAPALWAMGYTGKGRLSYSVDTGVWPDHPAIADRFMANFLPYAQTWFPYDFPIPKDKSGSHGTHTIGTTLGLDPATNDTIGVAFNARWIASDPVATSLATVIPVADFMYAFQWGLNPDGDTATTWDVPDVINNSWGFVPPTDTNMCTSFISLTFDAVEAAGIANVHSAGNDGPGSMSIPYPAHIASGLVNVFTVGAVNAADTNLPIANFSSRGPTICPVSGSEKIKPEVVAPGTNVRSAVGQNSYANYQGTSMAAPHVSGAVLLLKEAFPFLSGEDILMALYMSAKDLGTPGEDNTYGRGMIDVLAAFNYLSATYTPAPPAGSPAWDAAITGLIGSDLQIRCAETVTLLPKIKNLGDSSFSGGTFSYGFIGGTMQSQPYSGTLAPGVADSVQLPPLTVSGTGNLELLVKFTPNIPAAEPDTLNNRRFYRFNQRPVVSLPFFEDFETIRPDSSDWYVVDDDGVVTWDTLAAGGLTGSSFSAYMNFPNYDPKILQKDFLLSPLLPLPDTGAVTLTFDLAYQHRHNVFSDSLRIEISTDCGLTWPHRPWHQGGADLSTWSTVTPNFVPSIPDQWRTETVDLSAFAGSGEVLLRFTGVNNKGNNLFIDNVRLFAGPPVGSGELLDVRNVGPPFPNPTCDILYVPYAGNAVPRLELLNLLGKRVAVRILPLQEKNVLQLDFGKIPSGLYLLRITGPEGIHTFKIRKGKL